MLFQGVTQGKTSTTFSALSYLPVCFEQSTFVCLLSLLCLLTKYISVVALIVIYQPSFRSDFLSHTHLHWVCAFRDQNPVRLTSLKLFRSTFKSTSFKSISRKANPKDNINLFGVPTLQFNLQVYLKDNFLCRAKVNTKQ